MHRSLLSCVFCVALVGCVKPPDLPPADRQSQGEAPRLVPMSSLLDQAQTSSSATAASVAAAPQARAAALRARAARLRGAVIAPQERARLGASEASLR